MIRPHGSSPHHSVALVPADRQFGKAPAALNRTIKLDEMLAPTMAKVWDKNHLTILIQHGWLCLTGAGWSDTGL
jgi:hypothetical protein